MNRLAERMFLDLREEDLAGYAQAADAPIAIAPVSIIGVVENLRGLHRHAMIVLAAVEPERTPDAAPEAFEP
jgi:hypothetical protein